LKIIKKTMKNLILFLMLIVMFFASANTLQAQNKIKQARKEYIIRRLNLTSEQNTKFTPILDQYFENIDAVRKEKRNLRMEAVSFTASDAELLADLDKMLVLQQKEVDIEKEYVAKFKTTLNARQIVELYRANKDFNRKLLDKLQEN
jgi:hypothetical protein